MALCGLGCAPPFDYVDGTVLRFGLGWSGPSTTPVILLALFCVYRWHALLLLVIVGLDRDGFATFW